MCFRNDEIAYAIRQFIYLIALDLLFVPFPFRNTLQGGDILQSQRVQAWNYIQAYS